MLLEQKLSTTPKAMTKGNLYGIALGGTFGRGIIFKLGGTGHDARVRHTIVGNFTCSAEFYVP